MLLVFVQSSLLYSAFENKGIGSRNIALGNSTVAAIENLYAIYYNPAGIQYEKKMVIGCSFYYYYGLQDINHYVFVGSMRSGESSISLSISTYGNKLYKEWDLAAGIAFTPQKNIKFGLSINQYILSIRNYGSKGILGINIGMIYFVQENLYLGAVFFNLNRPTIRKEKEFINSSASLGLSYYIFKSITLYASLNKQHMLSEDYHFGIEYYLMGIMFVRFGTEINKKIICTGIGVENRHLILNYSLRWHPWLGNSHSISISFTL
jgi:hypothetical protein